MTEFQYIFLFDWFGNYFDPMDTDSISLFSSICVYNKTYGGVLASDWLRVIMTSYLPQILDSYWSRAIILYFLNIFFYIDIVPWARRRRCRTWRWWSRGRGRCRTLPRDDARRIRVKVKLSVWWLQILSFFFLYLDPGV